jgi:hypothetical protein
MGQRTVDFPIRRMLVQLDKLRGCHTCKDRKGCDRYIFVSDATNAIIEENGFEKSFMGQILARSLSWAIADEAFLSSLVAEGDDELYYEDELHPLFYALESIRDHIRELTELILEMRNRDGSS